MADDIRFHQKNGTWKLVKLNRTVRRRLVRGKWVIKSKSGRNGWIIRVKARWVVQVFMHRDGIDYHETLAAVVKHTSCKAIFAVAAASDWDLEQIGVKTAFLWEKIDQLTFVEQPTGFEKKGDYVCQLVKTLYGLKQSPSIWHWTITILLKNLGFVPLAADYSVFIHHERRHS